MQGWRRIGRTAYAVLLLALGALSMGAGTASADPSAVIGQWRFDEAGGQLAVDDGVFALDGRLGLTDGVDPRDPVRIPGASAATGALHFDGGEFVRLPAASELEPAALTLETVVRGAGSPGKFRYVVAHGAQGCVAGAYGMYTGEHGGIAFYVWDGQNYYVTAEVAPSDIWNGAWHHVAGTFDGHSLRLFVDGHPVGAALPAVLNIFYALTSHDHYFGTYQGTCALPMRGDIDLVRMWDGPLAPDFVADLADRSLGPPSPDAPPAAVPSATQQQSQGDAGATRSTLAPIAEGTTYRSPPGSIKAGGKATSTPGAPARACVVTPSAKRVRAGHATTLTVHVALRGKPLKSVRIVAMASSKRRVGQAKTAANGRARLHLKSSRRGTIRLKAADRQDCATAQLTVVSAKAKR